MGFSFLHSTTLTASASRAKQQGRQCKKQQQWNLLQVLRITAPLLRRKGFSSFSFKCLPCCHWATAATSVALPGCRDREKGEKKTLEFLPPSLTLRRCLSCSSDQKAPLSGVPSVHAWSACPGFGSLQV